MTVRVLIRILCVTALVIALPRPAAAHPGGHGMTVGSALHVWTDPSTGQRMPGSLLFVVGDTVHVEDVAGRVHTWPMRSLTPEDRALAQDFRARVDRLNGVRPSMPPASRRPPMPLPWTWLWAGLVAAALLAWRPRVGLGVPALVRLPVIASLVALPLACGGSSVVPSVTAPSTSSATTAGTAFAFPLATYFTAFPGHVRTRQDSQYFYVESDGLADHTLMTGIRSWQQQVPLPQPYTGTNAYSIPLTARLSSQPISARTALFNGAIAVAVNGVPIFNALNNRGDDAYLFGELDDYGGHSGRADDYHYHIAPFQLESTVGSTRPIAVALDGFPLYGTKEPDGSAVRALDDYNGHTDAATVYHYHGTRTYPYINGGMKGVVTVVSDHVDPQPTLKPVRPAGTPLAGATITGWAATGTNAWRLEYRINNATYRVDYRVDGAVYTFVFTDPSGATRTETYTR